MEQRAGRGPDQPTEIPQASDIRMSERKLPVVTRENFRLVSLDEPPKNVSPVTVSQRIYGLIDGLGRQEIDLTLTFTTSVVLAPSAVSKN